MAETHKRIRLTQDARDYLDAIYKAGNKHPKPRERVQLLEQIHKFPGNETYTKESLGRWFAQRRAHETKTSSKPDSFPISHTHNILYPSLTYDGLLRLGALYKEHIDNYKSHPPARLISLWASAISAVPKHVQNWVDERIALEESLQASLQVAAPSAAKPPPEVTRSLSLHQQQHAEQQSSSSLVNPSNDVRSLSHLPTPSQSTSPEPRTIQQFPSVKHELPLSPTMGRDPAPPPLSVYKAITLPQDFDRQKFDEHVKQLASTYLPSPVSPCFPEEDLPVFVRRSTKTHHPNPQIIPYHQTSNVPSTSTTTTTTHKPTHQTTLPPLPTPHNRNSNRHQQKHLVPILPPDLETRLSKLVTNQDLSPTPAAHTTTAFNHLIQPYETKMQGFINQVSSGAFRQAGWDSHLVNQNNTNPLPSLSLAAAPPPPPFNIMRS